MAADVLNRETVRDKLADLLNTALVGSGLPAQAVYAYKVGDFGGLSPVVVVTSAGSNRSKQAEADRTYSIVYLDIHVFVVYAAEDADGAVTWLEDDAEDRLDLLEKEIIDVLMDNDTLDNYWAWLSLNGDSTIETLPMSEGAYLHEVIPVRLELYSE